MNRKTPHPRVRRATLQSFAILSAAWALSTAALASEEADTAVLFVDPVQSVLDVTIEVQFVAASDSETQPIAWSGTLGALMAPGTGLRMGEAATSASFQNGSLDAEPASFALSLGDPPGFPIVIDLIDLSATFGNATLPATPDAPAHSLLDLSQLELYVRCDSCTLTLEGLPPDPLDPEIFTFVLPLTGNGEIQTLADGILEVIVPVSSTDTVTTTIDVFTYTVTVTIDGSLVFDGQMGSPVPMLPVGGLATLGVGLLAIAALLIARSARSPA
jgi:hypothetical protein